MPPDPPHRPVDRIRRPEPAAIRDVWPSEPRDFTPWPAKNLDHLDILGLGPLACLQVEAAVPGTYRSLDILAGPESVGPRGVIRPDRCRHAGSRSIRGVASGRAREPA